MRRWDNLALYDLDNDRKEVIPNEDLLPEEVLNVDSEILDHAVYAKTPVEAAAGIGMVGDRLYFAASFKLWSLRLGD